jgi:hypothetical protein
MVFGPTALQVDERVLAYEGGDAYCPGRLAYRAQDRPVVRLREGQLGADGPSLWDRMTSSTR